MPDNVVVNACWEDVYPKFVADTTTMSLVDTENVDDVTASSKSSSPTHDVAET